jgi:cytochrome c
MCAVNCFSEENTVAKSFLGRLAVGFVGAGLMMVSVSASAAALKGDAHHGEEIYQECAGCHSMTDNVIGPRHCGVVGRKAGSVKDYPSYTDVMKDSGITWTPEKLDEFLASPLSYLSGTAMGFAGIGDAQHRADVIAYLQQAGSDPKVCGSVPK